MPESLHVPTSHAPHDAKSTPVDVPQPEQRTENSRCANIARHLQAQARTHPSQLAVAVAQGRPGRARQSSSSNSDAGPFRELSFAQLDELSDRYAHALRDAGLRRGMRVVVMVKPSPAFFGLTFALFKVGAVLVFLDPGMGLRALRTCMAEVEPEAFIGVPKAHIARALLGWGKASIRLRMAVDGWTPWSGVDLDRKARKMPDRGFAVDEYDGNETAAILFTSGSTGIPKGARYTHGMFTAQVEAIRAGYGIEPGEVDLSTFPLFALFGPALGMASVVPDMDTSKPGSADPECLGRVLQHYRCTNAFASPAIIPKLADYAERSGQPYSHLRRIISAGAPANNAALERLQAWLPEGVDVWTSYGATECMPMAKFPSREISAHTRALTDEGAGVCLGPALSGVEMRVIEISDESIAHASDVTDCDTGTIGEIIVRSATASPDYVARPEQTDKAKIRDGEGVRDFWHRMGDVGYRDGDGQFWMCGRKSHRVVLDDGNTLFTIPCEAPFNTHPKVARSALVGVRRAGKMIPILCVETVKGAGVDDTLRRELGEIAQRRPHTADIREFSFYAELPVDVRHNAKIFRERLCELEQAKAP